MGRTRSTPARFLPLLLLAVACGGADDADTTPDAAAADSSTPPNATMPAPPDSASIDSTITPPVDLPATSEPQPVSPGADTPSRGGRADATPPPSPTGQPATAAPAPPSQDPAAILKRTATVYEGVRSMRADFTLVAQNPLLRSRRTSHGTLYQRRPDRIKLDFSDPEGDVIVSDGTYFWVFYPSVTPDQVLRTPAAEAGSGGVDLQAQFVGDPTERFVYTYEGTERVAGRSAHVFTLVPRKPQGYQKLKVWIDAGDALIRRFELTETNGTVRLFEFTDIERNPTLGDELFRFQVPAGVRVVSR